MKIMLNRQIVGNVYWFTPDQKIHVSTIKPSQTIAEPERLSDEQIKLLLLAADKGKILIDRIDVLRSIEKTRKASRVDEFVEETVKKNREPINTQEELRQAKHKELYDEAEKLAALSLSRMRAALENEDNPELVSLAYNIEHKKDEPRKGAIRMLWEKLESMPDVIVAKTEDVADMFEIEDKEEGQVAITTDGEIVGEVK